MNTNEFLDARRARSDARLREFQVAIEERLADERAEIIGDHTCIYAVGSGGRGELGSHSDLDVFLVTQRDARRMDEARLQAAVIRAMRDTRFTDPSRDGEFIKLHTVEAMIARLGGLRDDVENTFTGRMLLLLESRPLVGEDVYRQLVVRSLSAYWKNLAGHADHYLPIIFLNDVIRYWRIVLLNYEAHTEEERSILAARKDLTSEARAEAERKLDAKRRIRSFKLRFSRCLSAYATVAYLLGEVRATGKVAGDRAVDMVTKTPLERLEHAMACARSAELDELGAQLKELYTRFLRVTDADKASLEGIFGDRTTAAPCMQWADDFGLLMYRFVEAIGGATNPLYRFVVV